MTAGPQDPYSTDPGGQASSAPPGSDVPAYGAAPGYGQAPSYGQAPGGGRPELASWGLRLGGYLIDVVILTVITVAVILLISQQVANLVQVVLYYGLFGYLTGTTGQTPGRKVVGITVLREQDGQVLGAGMGIVRNICHLLDALPLLLGFFWPLWDKKNQTFADKIVKSVVVKA
jgi:uncharacterized RDD family membrane protein YckC